MTPPLLLYRWQIVVKERSRAATELTEVAAADYASALQVAARSWNKEEVLPEVLKIERIGKIYVP